MTTSKSVVIDASLAVVNRTGAYHIAKDIISAFAPPASVRYWRLGGYGPEGFIRKVLARIMMREYSALGLKDKFLIGKRNEGSEERVLFLDPLYALRSDLKSSDYVLCHDPGPLTHKFLYSEKVCEIYKAAYDKIASVRPHIIFVSSWSKSQFCQIFADNFPLLRVIPLYLRSGFLAEDPKPVARVQKPFFLTVGSFEVRKNQIGALKAFKKSGLAEKGYQYVLCGARGDAKHEIRELGENTPGVIMPGYVDDAELRWLYSNAEAFVLPSLLEGFGMPALEAASMGLLPVVSEDSALEEAVGGFCVSIDPRSEDSIAEALISVSKRTEDDKAEMAEKLKAFASQWTKERFLASWKQVIDEMYQAE